MRFVARRMSSSSSMSCTRSSVRVQPRAPWMPQTLLNRHSAGANCSASEPPPSMSTGSTSKKMQRSNAASRQSRSKAPTVEEAVQILKGLRPKYEAHHKAKLTDEALEAAVRLSDRYITG